ncbi:hypothetical protein [Formosa sp. PL04]|uniref:hypothetical protein n=1 Tax=Formosa sp. PL04 TaxID=3081755 RepID=UPI0029826BB8|nr:hypothetical protein [Formosa sp. PL04]MDW5290440.1 hypothetical protein [Formosa sp. PL04]
MQYLKWILFVTCNVLLYAKVNAQTVTIKGEVTGADDIENIHVINKTSKTFTITNNVGQFEISAKLKDTLVFSSIQYTGLEVIIDATVIINKTITVNLEEYVNTLDEVIVGKVLTGNLMLDIGSNEITPDINFYDVGISGFTGTRKTQTERRLQEATGGGLLAINPIINAISGRSKMMKMHVELERNDQLITKIRPNLSEDFFSDHPLSEFKQMDFWYFCSEDQNFKIRCENKGNIEILNFLNEKYAEYIKSSNITPN